MQAQQRRKKFRTSLLKVVDLTLRNTHDLASRPKIRKEIKDKMWTDEFGNIVNKYMIDELNEGQLVPHLAGCKRSRRISKSVKKEVANVYSAQGKGGVIKVGNKNVGYGTMAQRCRNKFASGGYVNSAQTAVIGEAGPEYVIPALRMDSALANYAAGKRGDAVLSQQVNVTI